MNDESSTVPQFWEIDHEKSKASWLELKDTQNADPDHYPKWSMVLKWDGCCHLHERGVPEEVDKDGADYWHLCGGVRAFDEMIARLQQAKAIAERFFTEEPAREEWGFDER